MVKASVLQLCCKCDALHTARDAIGRLATTCALPEPLMLHANEELFSAYLNRRLILEEITLRQMSICFGDAYFLFDHS